MGKAKETLRKKELILQNLLTATNVQQIKTEDALLHRSDTSSLSEHNEYYTALLKAYVEEFRENSQNKRKNKKDLFDIAKMLLVFVPLGTFIFLIATLCLFAYDKINIFESLPGLFIALTSLLGTYMVVPQMITKYLFNKKEEKRLAKIISKIQKYDRDIRNISKNNNDVD
ncbi:MAG: hypothetical protein HDR08_11135 [Lachnospiraceae bacterium]|nr:hypothetical protein [Lachnospiraceae bacterium]